MTVEMRVDCENGDYRELEANFTMTRNTSYSDNSKNFNNATVVDLADDDH